MAELLEEPDDHPHVVVVDQVVDVVGGGGGRLVARGDEVAQADVPSRIQERDADGAALHHRRHASGREMIRDGSAPRGGAAGEVDEAEAVRPAHRHAVGTGDGGELALGAHAVRARFPEAAREHHRASRAFESGRANRIHHRGLRHGDEHRVDGIGNRVEGRIRPPAEELGPAGRDEVNHACVADPLEGEPGIESGADLVGSTHDGDRCRAEEPGDAHWSENLGSRFSRKARGPSAASGCAKTSRQISCS